MTLRTKIISGVVVAAAVAIGAALYASPYRAVTQLRAAAEAGDRERLEAFVDFVALRESVKAEVNAALVAPALDKAKNRPYGGLGAMLAGAMVGPMVDSIVTPAGIAAMVQHGRARMAPGDDRVQRPNPWSGEPSSAPPDAAGSAPGAPTVERPKPTMGYAGVNRFVVAFRVPRKGNEEGEFRLIFRRDGLFGWKLSQVRFPAASR